VGSLLFGERLEYVCNSGYTTSGLPGGDQSFEVNCQADGTLSAVWGCQPISCGELPLIPYASVVKQNDATSEVVAYFCDMGFTLDGRPDGEVSFQVVCQADGTFSKKDQTCIPISCGLPPMVRHAVGHTSSPVDFGQEVRYTCEEGYSIDGSIAGPLHYSARCQADGIFSTILECHPISCGMPPSIQHAALPRDISFLSFLFGQRLKYVCDFGHTINGHPGGEQSFEVSCQADGVFSVPLACQPISCGKPPLMPSASLVSKRAYTFSDPAIYKCRDGFTAGGKPDGRVRFKMFCGVDGAYIRVPGCQPTVKKTVADKADTLKTSAGNNRRLGAVMPVQGQGYPSIILV